MNKTKIEWTDMTWNPMKGLCPMGCWYCYARRFYQRFKWNPEIRLDKKELLKPLKIKKPKKIFVCSTIELFHPDIPKDYRDSVFEIIKKTPQHTYQVLTKLPAFVDREMPANVWLGASLECLEYPDILRILYLVRDCNAKIKFISLEPWLDYSIRHLRILSLIDWLIIGGITGVKGNRPTKEQIAKVVEIAHENNIPVFIKDNLADIWGEPLIQEFPKGDKP